MPPQRSRANVPRFPGEFLRRGSHVPGDVGAGHAAGYSAAEAAHVFEEFLEFRLSHDAFWAWLQSYPVLPEGARDVQVEDEIDHAILALLAFQKGTRDWHEVERELRASRARLTGLARY